MEDGYVFYRSKNIDFIKINSWTWEVKDIDNNSAEHLIRCLKWALIISL